MSKDEEMRLMSTDRRKLAKILVPAALVLVICCGGVAWYLANQSPKTYGVPLVVNAEGLDTEKGTKIPLHATGEDARGNHVDEVFYGGTDSSDVTLASGAYTLSIEDSPIAEDGTIYNTEGAFTKADISKDGGADVESEITITPIPAEDVTDEEIEKAYNAAKSSGIEASRLDSLKEKAKERRDAAVAEKEAAEKQAAQEKEALASDGHSFSNDYFYIDVPADWKPSEWSVEQISASGWRFSYDPENDYGGGADIVVASDDPWPKNGNTKDLGKLADGQNVYASEAGAGFLKYVTFGLNSTWQNDHDYAQAHGLTDEGETDWDAIWEAREWHKQHSAE